MMCRWCFTALLLISSLTFADQGLHDTPVDAVDSVQQSVLPAASVDVESSESSVSPAAKKSPAKSSSSLIKASSPAGASGIGSAVVTANPVSVIAGLFAVLALIFLVAWLMRRIGTMQMLTGQSMRIVSALSVGGREKIMLVSVGDKQMLIGVAPGRVSQLHYFDEPVVATNQGASNDFSQTIKKILQQNNKSEIGQQAGDK